MKVRFHIIGLTNKNPQKTTPLSVFVCKKEQCKSQIVSTDTDLQKYVCLKTALNQTLLLHKL